MEFKQFKELLQKSFKTEWLSHRTANPGSFWSAQVRILLAALATVV